MAAEAALRADLLQRLGSAEGHLRGIASMVERGADCVNVVHQTLAMQTALRQITRLALRHHLEHCVRQRLTGLVTLAAAVPLLVRRLTRAGRPRAIAAP